jgi:hypothetical protein
MGIATLLLRKSAPSTYGMPLLMLWLCSVCVSPYQFNSTGEVTLTNGEKNPAILYWGHVKGRRWYGKKHQQTDSSLVLKIGGRPSLLCNNQQDPS